jgi:N-acetylglucosamine malate deacetylase 1
MSKKVLVVAAHPDDEVLGCGATIVKHIKNGDEVLVLILGEGITARKELQEEQKEKNLEDLKSNAQEANRILGTTRLVMKSLPDNRFDSVDLLSIVHEIEKVVEKFDPEIVYSHHRGDVNIDHQRTIEALEAAVRPMIGKSVRQLVSFEVASATNWNFVKDSQYFKPNVFNEITEEMLLKKVEALKAYDGELRSFPHPRSTEYLTCKAKIRGADSGMMLAEAFVLIYERRI